MRGAAATIESGGARRVRVGVGVAAFCLVGVAQVVGAEVSIDARLDRTEVPVNQRATLTVTVTGTSRAAQPELPDLPAFTVVSAGSSHLVSSVNFKTTTSTVFTYILVPKTEGRFEIPPITLEHEGVELRTRPLSVTVVAATAELPARPARPPRPRSESGLDEDVILLEAEAEPRQVFVGEQVTLVVRYYQDAFADPVEQPQYQRPSTTGFWVEDLGEPRTYAQVRQGRQYHVTELKYALFPTEPGSHTIGSARVNCLFGASGDPFSRSPFRMFGRRGAERRTVETDPITIEAADLPRNGRPDSWNGAVGRFTLAAAADKTEVEAGEAVTLTVTVRGVGNMRGVGEPEIGDVEGMRSYDGGTDIEESRQGDRVAGVRLSKKVFIAGAEGTFSLPAVEYAYFDPSARRYQTLSTRPIEIVVAGNGGGTRIAARARDASDLGPITPDLSFIHLGDPELKGRARPLYRSGWFWALQVFPLIGLVAGLAFARHAQRVREDVAYARSRRSLGVAQRRLREARRDLTGGNADVTLSSVSAALVGFVADRANRAAAGMTLDDLRSILEDRGIETALIERYGRTVERCNFGRFAPGAQAADERRELLAEAETVLAELARRGV